MPFDIVNPLLIYTVGTCFLKSFSLRLLGPVYQNYNYYMPLGVFDFPLPLSLRKSEVYQELYGQEAPPGKREARCPDRVRIR